VLQGMYFVDAYEDMELKPAAGHNNDFKKFD
jgi:hypothetical protein